MLKRFLSLNFAISKPAWITFKVWKIDCPPQTSKWMTSRTSLGCGLGQQVTPTWIAAIQGLVLPNFRDAKYARDYTGTWDMVQTWHGHLFNFILIHPNAVHSNHSRLWAALQMPRANLLTHPACASTAANTCDLGSSKAQNSAASTLMDGGSETACLLKHSIINLWHAKHVDTCHEQRFLQKHLECMHACQPLTISNPEIWWALVWRMHTWIRYRYTHVYIHLDVCERCFKF